MKLRLLLAVLAAASPAMAELSCEGDAFDAARAEVRVKAGLPENPYEQGGEPTAGQNRQLAAGYAALIERCPADAMLRLDHFAALDQPDTPDAQLLAAAEGTAAALAAEHGKMFSPRPPGTRIVQALLDRQLAPAMSLAIVEASRKDLELFIERRKNLPAEEVPPPEVAAMLRSVTKGTEALFAIYETRARLQLGEIAAAREKLAAAHVILSAAGPTPPGQPATQFAVARQELLAAAPQGEAPPELVLAPPAPAVKEDVSFRTVEVEIEGLPLDDAQGKTWQLADLGGKTWLINLWATWCGPCMAELPHIQKLYEELKERRDVGVLTINFDTDPRKVQPFLTRKSYTFPVLLAGKGLGRYTREGIPQNWLVDRAGKIRRKATGFDVENPQGFLDEVKQGLEQLKAP